MHRLAAAEGEVRGSLVGANYAVAWPVGRQRISAHHELSCCCSSPLTPCAASPLPCRLGPVSLVCRRLAAAARNPELLRELDVGELLNLAAVRSFTAFLAAPNKFLEEADPKPAYGQQLQRLKLSCADGTAEGKARAAAAVTACLMQAGASGQLTELSAGGCIRGTEWLPAMRSLRRLELTAKSVGTTPLRITPLRILPAISGLTALGSLELSWYHISFEGGARLPPSITFLVIEDDYPRNAHDLPEQASLCMLFQAV